jgi:hypothetical protein
MLSTNGDVVRHYWCPAANGASAQLDILQNVQSSPFMVTTIVIYG